MSASLVLQRFRKYDRAVQLHPSRWRPLLLAPIAGALSLVASLVAAAPARADGRVVIMPFAGESDESLAATLLVASMLTKGERDMASFVDTLRKLYADRNAATGKPTALCQATSADRAVLGDLRLVETELELSLKGVDCNGVDVSSSKNKSLRGELHPLISGAVNNLAPHLGLKAITGDAMHMGLLRAPARALRSIINGDLPGAVAQLQVTDLKVAHRVSSVRELGRFLAAQPGLTPLQRMEAALAAADPDLALTIAAAQKGPKAPELVAATARAYVQKGDSQRADKELATLPKSKDGKDANPAVTLARLELAQARGDKAGQAELEKLAKPALEGGGNAPIVAFMSRLPPNSLGAEGETALVAAAKALPPNAAPGVASAVGARAAARNDPAGVGMMQMDDYDQAQLQAITAGLQGGGGTMGDLQKLQTGQALPGTPGAPGAAGPLGPVAAQLQAVMAQRNKKPTANSLKLDKKEGDKPADNLPPPINTGLPPEVMGQFGKLLTNFPALAEAKGAKVVVVERVANSSPLMHPLHVELGGLHRAIVAALTQEPYRLEPHHAKLKPVKEMSVESLTELADSTKSRFVVLYAPEILMDGVNLKLIVFDRSTEEAFDFGERIRGPEFHKWNPVFFVPFVLIGIVGLWLLVRQLRGGRVTVEVTGGPYGQKQILCVQLSQSGRPPAIPFDKFEEELAKQPKDPLRKTRVGRVTKFERVGKGTWYAHAFGVCFIDDKPMALVGSLSAELVVSVGHVSKVTLAMRSPLPHIKADVFDGEEPVQAKIYLAGFEDKQYETDKNGTVTFDVPLGRHMVHFLFPDGTEITKPVQIVPGQGTEYLKIDVKHEQRLRPIEMKKEEEHNEYSAAAVSQQYTEAAAAPPPDDGGGLLASMDDTDFSAMSAAAAPPPPRSPEPVHVPAPEPEPEAEPDGAPAIGLGEIGLADLDPEPPPVAAPPPPVIAPPPPSRASAPPPRGAAPPPSPSNGQRYQREGELVRTPACIVYRGRDAAKGRAVALQYLADELRSNSQALAAFFEDNRALATLDSPNLVRVVEAVESGPFVVTELADGHTAEKLVAEQRGKLPVAKVIAIAEQVAAGLAVAHQKRLLHRDLRPGYISVDGDGKARLGGFGVGRAVRVARNKNALQPRYLAPEQLRGEEPDAQTDLYALGLVVYELLVGSPPFTEGDVASSQLHDEPPAPSARRSDVPRALDDAILACLAKEKYERPSTAQELRTMLSKIRVR